MIIVNKIMYRKLVFYLRNFMALISFYSTYVKLLFLCNSDPFQKNCNNGKTLDVLITSTLGELSQLPGYWSKKFKRPRSFRKDFAKDSVAHYQSLNFDFLPSLLSKNFSAPFARSSLSVNSLWIGKIKRWFNRLFDIVKRR